MKRFHTRVTRKLKFGLGLAINYSRKGEKVKAMLGVLMEGRQELKSEYQICHPTPLNYIVFCHNRSHSELFPNNNNKCEELKNDVAENFDF